MLYLLFRKDRKGVFKIGVSIDIAKRFEVIGACSSNIDFGKSMVVESKSYSHLERILHNGFAEYRVDSFDESGGSEWFRSKCFKDVVKFLESNSGILCISNIGPIRKDIIKLLNKPKNTNKCKPSNLVMVFDDGGWLNATLAASSKCKTTSEWLRLPSTRRFIEIGGVKIESFVKSSKGRVDRGGGTWIHPLLVQKFIEWVDFEYYVKQVEC